MNFIIFCLFLIFFVFTVIQDSTFIMVFSLISVFLLATFLLILNSFEFLGYLLLIVYVGAVAVLFIFMVMLFDKSEYQIFREAATPENKLLKFISAYFLSFLMLSALMLNFSFFLFPFLKYFTLLDFLYKNEIFNHLFPNEPEVTLTTISDIYEIGLVLYTDYFFVFILAGFGLLIAMIGSILITRMFYTRVVDKPKRHTQDVSIQLARISTRDIKIKN